MNPALAAVTGTGAITALGEGAAALWHATLHGESAMQNGFGRIPAAALSRAEQSHPGKTALGLAVLSAREAMRDAGWSGLEAGDGILIGTTTGQAGYWEPSTLAYLKDGSDPALFAERYAGNPLGLLARELSSELGGARPSLGPVQTIASACCASTQAIAVAAQWIASSRVRRCLVGGVELLCDLTRTGFESLQLVHPGRCQPFDGDRKGINLSEAAVFLCLEAPQPGRGYANISGFGIAGDASHMTAPHPEGDGCRRSMQLALRMAGVAPEAVGWIHAHGTGSRHNDIAEARAIRAVFATPPPVSSTKSVHGHALGAAGALESLLVCHALRAGRLPATTGLENLDPEIGLLQVLREPLAARPAHVLKNTLAFGGVNASLVFSAVQA